MPSGLHRTYGAHRLHFITTSCYRRLPFLSAAGSRDIFLAILEQARERYRFVVVGYVVMPEHVHMLLTEPEIGTLSTVMQVLKQQSAGRARGTRPFAKNAKERGTHCVADSGEFKGWATRLARFFRDGCKLAL